jgi:hypothetical protein
MSCDPKGNGVGAFCQNEPNFWDLVRRGPISNFAKTNPISATKSAVPAELPPLYSAIQRQRMRSRQNYVFFESL